VLKDQGKGTEAIITKLAAQRGKKLVTTYDVQIVGENGKSNNVNSAQYNQTNPYLENMLASFEDAMRVQEKFNGMANVTQLAITMYISRNKANGLAN